MVAGGEVPDIARYLPPSRGRRAARWCSAAEAVAQIPDRARVFLAAGPTPPMHLVQALDDRRDRWARLELVSPLMQHRLPLFDHAGRPFHFVSTQASPVYRGLWASGFVDVLPTRYSDHAGLCAADGPLPVDVALITVSPPGPEGKVSLGLSVGTAVTPARSAPLVIAQVNNEVPYTFGAGELAVEEIDLLVRGDEPIVDNRAGGAPADAASNGIADLAAAMVPDGATIQFGIGSIPDAILSRLRSRTGLRVHSGLVNEACADLHDAGVVEGVMVSGEVVSTPRMNAWAHRNPALFMGPPALTHGAVALGALERFVAINSAVEVALDGSANSETAGGEVISGPGGVPDFAFGASIATGGRMILALRSTAAKGALSRIIRAIDPPAPVTLANYLADVVVTEHGLAEVRGLAGAARADALRALADPAHRAALR
jgi:acetyl-CoA hydrolase